MTNLQRIQDVKQFINRNLAGDLSLSVLASVAYLSQYHFQRLFKQIEGETPKQYIKRIRLETSAHTLTLNSTITILDVSIENGFSSMETFSRAFKNHYGLSPSNFRDLEKEEKLRILDSRFEYGHDRNLSEEIPFERLKFSTKHVISFQHPFQSRLAVIEGFVKMRTFAVSSGIQLNSNSIFGLLMDHPSVTQLEKCRFYICLESSTDVDTPDGFNQMSVEAANFLSLNIEGDIPNWLSIIEAFVINQLLPSGYRIKHTSGALIFPIPKTDCKEFHPAKFKAFIPIEIG